MQIKGRLDGVHIEREFILNGNASITVKTDLPKSNHVGNIKFKREVDAMTMYELIKQTIKIVEY